MAPVEVDTAVAVLDEAEPLEIEITGRPLVVHMGVEHTAVAEDMVVTAAADTVVAGDTVAVDTAAAAADMAEEDPITLPNMAVVEEAEEAVSLRPAGGRLDLSQLFGFDHSTKGPSRIDTHCPPRVIFPSGFPVLMVLSRSAVSFSILLFFFSPPMFRSPSHFVPPSVFIVSVNISSYLFFLSPFILS